MAPRPSFYSPGSVAVDPLPDFGLFELLGAAVLGALARGIYSRRLLGFIFLVLSIAAPVGIILFGRGDLTKWLGAVALATALVNGAFIFRVMRSSVPARQDS